jgi:hypothetical protein
MDREIDRTVTNGYIRIKEKLNALINHRFEWINWTMNKKSYMYTPDTGSLMCDILGWGSFIPLEIKGSENDGK